MITSTRFTAAQLNIALALGSVLLGASGCSLLFAPSRWQGGNPDQDAGVDESVDAFVEPTLDAYVDPTTDALVSPDAFAPTPCTDDAECGLDEYCDGTSCRDCDADADGLPAQACADGVFYDCDPEEAPSPTTVSLTDSDFADTLRVFRVGERTHLFWRNAGGAMRLALGVDSIGRPLQFSAGFSTARGVRAFDAVRTRDGVVVAGYDAEYAFRFDVTAGGVVDTANRALSGAAASGFVGLAPEGAPTLLRADAGVAFLSFPARYSDPGGVSYGGRVVLGMGDPRVVRFHPTAPSPEDFRTASGNGLAVIPDDTGDGRSVYLWNGDLRSDSETRTPLLLVPDSSAPVAWNQVAIGVGDGVRGMPAAQNVVVALAGSTGAVHVELLRCPADTTMSCLRESPKDYRIDGLEVGVVALSTPPSSGTDVLMLRSFPDELIVDMLDLEVDVGVFVLPSEPEPLLHITVPELSTPARALAMDLVLDGTTMPPRAHLVLARAATRQIQSVSMDVCITGP